MSSSLEFLSRYFEKFADDMRRNINDADYANWMENGRNFIGEVCDVNLREQALGKLRQVQSDVRMYDHFDEIPRDFLNSIADDIQELGNLIRQFR